MKRNQLLLLLSFALIFLTSCSSRNDQLVEKAQKFILDKSKDQLHGNTIFIKAVDSIVPMTEKRLRQTTVLFYMAKAKESIANSNDAEIFRNSQLMKSHKELLDNSSETKIVGNIVWYSCDLINVLSNKTKPYYLTLPFDENDKLIEFSAEHMISNIFN